MSFREFDWINSLKTTPKEYLTLGIGDDCAIFGGAEPWAISTDSLLEGSHFLPEDSPELVGWKSVCVSLSDLAGMGCRPMFLLMNLHVGEGVDERRIEGLRAGIFQAMDTYKLSLIGGDTICGGRGLGLVSTVLGKPFGGQPILRSGARANDFLCVTGYGLGGSYPYRHLSFSPRLDYSEALIEHLPPTAMMDLSDGLGGDLKHLLTKSRVGADLDLWKIPVSAELAMLDKREAVKRALSDGEDFELLFTVPPDKLGSMPSGFPYSVIGTITDQYGQVRARWNEDDEYAPFELEGFEHNGRVETE